jgi:predicted dehydrogenase
MQGSSTGGSIETFDSGSCAFVVVCTGAPHRGMGWYHSMQLLRGEVRGAHLAAIVEPWFLGDGSTAEYSADFAAFKEVAERQGVSFFQRVEELPPQSAQTRRVALIASRAADFPPLFQATVARGFDHIYLEKPGAPDVASMQKMVALAVEKQVPVSMGFNKNVAKYVRELRDFEVAHPDGRTTFVHNNDYTDDTLDECFVRNSIGIIHNMVIHELALCATFYGVTVDDMLSVEVDTEFSQCEMRAGHTDFRRLGFTITLNNGRSISVKADRCGGNNSQAIVAVGEDSTAFRSIMPDEELKAEVEAKVTADPATFGYFFTQHDDYITLKAAVAHNVLHGVKSTPAAVASIAVGLETLRLADYLVPLALQQCPPC